MQGTIVFTNRIDADITEAGLAVTQVPDWRAQERHCNNWVDTSIPEVCQIPGTWLDLQSFWAAVRGDGSRRKDYWGESTTVKEDTHILGGRSGSVLWGRRWIPETEEVPERTHCGYRVDSRSGADKRWASRPPLRHCSATVFIWRWLQYLNENYTREEFSLMCKNRNKPYRWSSTCHLGEDLETKKYLVGVSRDWATIQRFLWFVCWFVSGDRVLLCGPGQTQPGPSCLRLPSTETAGVCPHAWLGNWMGNPFSYFFILQVLILEAPMGLALG